jgi:hypothetical protein
MQTTYLIRDWTEKFARAYTDGVHIEFGLETPALVDVVFSAEDNGEGGADIRIDAVFPRKAIDLDGGEGRLMRFPAGVDCLDYLPPAIVQQMRDTIAIPKELDFYVELA